MTYIRRNNESLLCLPHTASCELSV
jgi:hypothetical protein